MENSQTRSKVGVDFDPLSPSQSQLESSDIHYNTNFHRTPAIEIVNTRTTHEYDHGVKSPARTLEIVIQKQI